jgi:hypothetical protein
MAYDAAHQKIVRFGGEDWNDDYNDTFTWDGTGGWVYEDPPSSPPPRSNTAMTYDAARAEVMLWLGSTWTWDGTTWTNKQPPVSPPDGCCIAYDAAREQVVLVGGSSGTWVWDGTTWRVPFKARLHLSPRSGPPGTAVHVKGTGFAGAEQVSLTFVDSVGGETVLGTFATDGSGNLDAQVTIPRNSAARVRISVGDQKIVAVGAVSQQKAKAKFTVT